MSGPGNREYGDDLAPTFALIVEGTELQADITSWIQSVEFESAVDMADVLTITILNPGNVFGTGITVGDRRLSVDQQGPPDFISHKALQPGNAVDLYAGYGRADTFIGRALLTKHLPTFPGKGVPTLTVKGYDKTHLMMKAEGALTGGQLNRPQFAKDTPYDASRGADSGQDNKDPHETGRGFPNQKPHEIIQVIAGKWKLDTDIVVPKTSITPKEDVGVVQPRGMSDWELVRILANLNNYDTWVDWNPETRKWVLHWRPATDKQFPQAVFTYDAQDASTLLSLELEYGISDAITEIAVIAWDAKRHTWISVAFIETPFGPEPIFRKGGGLAERIERGTGRPRNEAKEQWYGESKQGDSSAEADALITENIKSATQFRFMAGGVAIDVVTGKPFGSVEEAVAFAQQWIDQRKNHFIVGHGTVVGMETLKARQIHQLMGIGQRLSGEYRFTSVKHKFAKKGSGLAYSCTFIANKVLI